MRIILDAEGGDNSPYVNIAGMIMFLDEMIFKNAKNEIKILLVGKSEVLETEVKKELENRKYNALEMEKIKAAIEIINADDVILMTDNPATAIKTKKQSSMRVAMEKLKEEKADIMVSCGNTGALLAGGVLVVGRIKGVKRPCLVAPIKLFDSDYIILDTGANSDCTSEFMYQFAVIGAVYKKFVDNVLLPKVGLLNIGTEANKGNKLYTETYEMLNENKIKDKTNNRFEFIGNIEARDPFLVDFDVLVSDGFTGNIFLKTLEGLRKNN